MFVMLINLRGVKESGLFAIPTYFFVVMMYITVVVGLGRFVFWLAWPGGGLSAHHGMMLPTSTADLFSSSCALCPAVLRLSLVWRPFRTA